MACKGCDSARRKVRDGAHGVRQRLHLDQHACAVLRRGLPAGLYQALLASSAGSQAFLRLSFADHTARLAFPTLALAHRLCSGRRP